MIPPPDAIETDRLVIRPFKPKDRSSYLDVMTHEEAAGYFILTDQQRTEEGAREHFERVRQSYDSDDPIFACAIARREDDECVGSCGVSELDEPGKLECYYSLLPSEWNNGYATEATIALLRHCFSTPEVQEVWAFVNPDNPGSAGIAERVGMDAEGIREHPVFGSEGRAYVMRRGVKKL